jgi:large subunit ribosomal protein L25
MEIKMSAVVGVISAKLRENTGKGVARTLRREGRIPAIIYGGGKKEVKISLDIKELVTESGRGHFTSKIYSLDTGAEKFRVLPLDIQVHPVTDVPEHADFIHVEPGSEVRVKVRVLFRNVDKSPGIKRGGVLNVIRHDVELLCREDRIPTKLEADLSGLQIGDSIHISNITLPEGSRPTITTRDFTIATIVGRMKDEAEEAALLASRAAAAAAAAAVEAAKVDEKKKKDTK